MKPSGKPGSSTGISVKPVTDNETPRQSERTGTWQFMSARLLLGRDGGLHTHVDDLESFFHVLCWIVLRVGHYSLEVKEAIEHLQAVYDYAVIYEGQTSGGAHKEARLMAYWMTQRAGVSNECLRNLVTDFEELVAVRYNKEPSKEARVEYNELAAAVNYQDRKLLNQPVWKYDKNKERLKDCSWIYERFCKAAEDPSKLSDVPNSKNLQIIKSEPLKVFGLPARTTKRGATDNIQSEHRSQKSKRD
uniref:Fungal-type protein kinase domain-containing protein n=1 Tax=Moniliophthora roreri TaxID=221103 RepID=A0A0W0GD47_MONRR